MRATVEEQWEKDTLIEMIKESEYNIGRLCDNILCSECYYNNRCIRTEIKITSPLQYYINKFGKEDLMEHLL